MNEVLAHVSGIQKTEELTDDEAALIARAKARVDAMIDVLFEFLEPEDTVSAEIRESLRDDLLLDALALSDESGETTVLSSQESAERFWFMTWFAYADPIGNGMNRAKGNYLCRLAHRAYTDEKMQQVPAAIAGLIHEPRYVIERTEIDGETGEISRSTSYASLYDVVSEWEELPPTSHYPSHDALLS